MILIKIRILQIMLILYQDILEFFEEFMGLVNKDLQFVIDKISTQDSSAVGVTWHLGIITPQLYIYIYIL